MCLLVTQTKSSPILSNEWLEDFYAYNSDGIGVMWANHGDLVIKKVLPKSADDFIHFYHSEIANKDCAFHLRMRTHGDIDLTNCHPYEVLTRSEHGIDLWLMHNGILSTGNKADESKSDTWHYINDYLRPMLSANPDFAFHPSFAEIVGEHIGSSNKFVLMDNEGRQAVINQNAGVYWAGLWLSNTYAWTASKNASKTPVKGIKKQTKQAKEKPQARVLYSPKYANNYGYVDYYGSGLDESEMDYSDWYEMACNEVDIWLDDLTYMGFPHAGKLSSSKALDFVEKFSLEDFKDICEMVMDKAIDEEWFIKVMTDHKLALECFPYLSRSNEYA
jgi:hypothetical protein